MLLPERNADGKPAIELTEEQKYLLDTRGWLLSPGVLMEAEITEMRAFCYRLHRDPQSIPLEERRPTREMLLALTPDERHALFRQWRALAPEQREAYRQKLLQMTAEQRAQALR